MNLFAEICDVVLNGRPARPEKPTPDGGYRLSEAIWEVAKLRWCRIRVKGVVYEIRVRRVKETHEN